MALQRTLGRCAAAIACALLLAGCASKGAEETSFGTIGKAIKSTVQARRAAPPKPLNITQRQLDNTNQGVLKAVSEIDGQANLLRRIVRRGDAYPGTLEVWQDSASGQVVLRNGVLVSTRGIGGDILGSDVSQTLSRLGALQAGSVQRTVYLPSGDNRQVTLKMNCTISDLGTEGIVLVEAPVALRHFRESCSDGALAVSYDYWIDPQTRLIRQSRQWTGPSTRFFQFTLLKN